MPIPPASLPRRALADGPSWLVERVNAGAAAAARLDLPYGDEAWKYLDLDVDVARLRSGEPGPPLADEGPFLGSVDLRSATGRVVDGVGAAPDLRVGDVMIAPLSEAVSGHAALMERAYLTTSQPDRDLFAAVHHASAPDGLLVRFSPDRVVEAPVVIDLQGVAEGAATFPHVILVAERGAQGSVILNTRSASGRRVVIPQIRTVVEDGANLTVTRAQHWSTGTVELGYHRVSLGRDASLRLGDVGLGGAAARLDLTVDLEGRGSSFEMVGAYFGDGEQVMDYRVVINHIAPNTSSNVFLKGAVEDAAESVFSGLLKIFPDAAKVSAFETNRNLVLSEHAKAHSVPNLEILCDDVVCGHGSTVGPLEADHIYYLQSRGLERDRAERLLVRGFFEEIITAIPSQIQEPTRVALNQKFVAAQQEGRL